MPYEIEGYGLYLLYHFLSFFCHSDTDMITVFFFKFYLKLFFSELAKYDNDENVG